MIRFLAALCVALQCSLAFAQEEVGDGPPAEVAAEAEVKRPGAGELEKKVAALTTQLERFNRAVVELYALSNDIAQVPESEREAVSFRRDERAFQLMKDLDRIARSAAELPVDEPFRVELTRRMQEEYAGFADGIFQRTSDLDRRIAEFTEQARGMSGSEQLALEAYVYALQGMRIASFNAAADLAEGRQALGLEAGNIVSVVERELYLYAETLVGRLKFFATAVQELRARLGKDTTNAELAAAVKRFETVRSLDMSRLREVSAVMDRLDIDSSDYKTVMLQQGETLSVRDIESDLLLTWMQETWRGVMESMAEKAPDAVLSLLIVLLILLVFRLLSRLVLRAVVLACERSGERMSTLLKDVLASVSGGTVMFVGILIALGYLGISLGPMLAGLGVAGFIVGFALQDTLGNFAAGGMILLYRPYDVDDYIEVAGASGLVKKMSLVSTTITTFDNQTLVVPNSKIWGDVIKNVTAQKVRRVDMEFGISYSDDIEQAEQVLRAIVEEHDSVLGKPEPMIKVHTLGDSSVNFIVRPWVRTADYWNTYWDITREVKLRFDREGISIPFPQRDVHVYREET